MRHDEELALHVTALLACACSALVFEAVIGLILVLAWLFAGVYMVVFSILNLLFSFHASYAVYATLSVFK